jgi:sugar-specific transcriptional regulator TrmB
MIDVKKIFKKNMPVIIPAAIAIVAIVLLVPTVMVRGKIKAKLSESANIAREVDSALYEAVSSKQPEIAIKYQDLHQADANAIDALAQQTSQRELLSYKIFPDPNETSAQIFNEFKREYKETFANFVQDLKALDAPTDAEIRKQAGAIDVQSLTGAATDRKSSDEKIVELICRSRGESIPVYANPWVFGGYAYWDNWEFAGMALAIRDCWYCQMAVWIHQDVISSIKAINAGSGSVASSSVKRLLASNFSGGSKDIGRDVPVYVTERSGGLCQPWTGRKCDDRIDVMHFTVSVIVRANDVLKFMKELCSEKEHKFAGFKGELPVQTYKHNSITILSSSIEPVDRTSTEHKRYYYGQDAVVKLDLICEYIFNRQGYDVIKPQVILDEISGTGQQDGGGGMGYPGGMGGGGMPGGPGGGMY